MKRLAPLCLACFFLFFGHRVSIAVTEDERAVFIEEFITAAIAEIGYTRAANGYTKYADWSGGKKYGQWCSDFVSWCVARADENLSAKLLDVLYPMQTSSAAGVKWHTERGRYVSATGILKGFGAQWHRADGVPLAQRPYVPRRGDLIYFEWYKYNRIDHVGIVEYVRMDPGGSYIIHTIEGNNVVLGKKQSGVERYSYPLDDPSIRAFGTTRDDVGTELRAGSEGPLVKEFQRMLVENGYDEVVLTGNYGSHTVRAVKNLQETHGLEATGVADRLTQAALGFPERADYP